MLWRSLPGTCIIQAEATALVLRSKWVKSPQISKITRGWQDIPLEVKEMITLKLDPLSYKALSECDKESYELCLLFSETLCEMHYPLATARHRSELASQANTSQSTATTDQLHRVLCKTATITKCLRTGQSLQYKEIKLPEELTPYTSLDCITEYGHGHLALCNLSVSGIHLMNLSRNKFEILPGSRYLCFVRAICVLQNRLCILGIDEGDHLFM